VSDSKHKSLSLNPRTAKKKKKDNSYKWKVEGQLPGAGEPGNRKIISQENKLSYKMSKF
jgi:hypothetical protein